MLEYKKDDLKATLVLLPTLLLTTVFMIYPIIRAFLMAFMDGYTYGAARGSTFVYNWFEHFGKTIETVDSLGNKTTFRIGIGIESFKHIWTDKTFLTSLGNTALIVVISVPLTIMVALFITVALNGIKKGQGVFQTIYFLPYVTNTIAVGLTFAAIFGSSSGLINSLRIGLGKEAIPWVNRVILDNGESRIPKYMAGFLVIIIHSLWHGLAFKIMVFLSGMQSIDKQYYQSAQIDSTPRERVFRRITVPLLSPMISYISITSFIGAFKVYTSVLALFNGKMGTDDNPDRYLTIVGYVYKWVGRSDEVNGQPRAAAASISLFIIIMIITIIQQQISKRKVHY